MNVSGELYNALTRLVAAGQPLRPFMGFASYSDAGEWIHAMVEAHHALHRAMLQTPTARDTP